MIENYVVDLGRLYPIVPLACAYVMILIATVINIILIKKKGKAPKKYLIIFVIVCIYFGLALFTQSHDQSFFMINDDDINKALELGKYKGLLNRLWHLFVYIHVSIFFIFFSFVVIKDYKQKNIKGELNKNIINEKQKQIVIVIVAFLLICYIVVVVIKSIFSELFYNIPNKDYSNWSITEEEIILDKKQESGLNYIRVNGYDEYYPIDSRDIEKYQKNKKAYIIFDSKKKIIGYFSCEQYQYTGDRLKETKYTK